MKEKLSITFLVLFLLLGSVSQAQVLSQPKSKSAAAGGKVKSYKKGKLLFQDDFSSGLGNWVTEAPATPDSKVTVDKGKLVIDVDGGTTVWLNKELAGNILIEYERKVVMGSGKNDRLSDLNQFWMASDPRNENLFSRTGTFSQYDSLQLYYAGFGGNTNTTTRFRKYTGNGERVLHEDLQDQEHLLEPNKTYKIKIIVQEGVTKFFVDDREFFSFQDPHPLQEGYFGFRTVQSRQEVDNFRVYKLQ